jgi:enolase
MVVPQEKTFTKNLEKGNEIYYSLKKILLEKLGKSAVNVGDEGGFAPQLEKTKETLDLVMAAIAKAGGDVKIGLDCAASYFYNNDKYTLEGNVLFRDALLLFYDDLVKNYPIVFLEDPFAEDDWQGFSAITKEFGKKGIDILGDDLTTTDIARIQEAKKKKACSGVIIKPNQIGTVTETLEAVKTAKSANWKIMVSHRSGDTCDDFIADLAVGIRADYIKSGAPARGERLAKYNRLLKIEEEIKK